MGQDPERTLPVQSYAGEVRDSPDQRPCVTGRKNSDLYRTGKIPADVLISGQEPVSQHEPAIIRPWLSRKSEKKQGGSSLELLLKFLEFLLGLFAPCSRLL